MGESPRVLNMISGPVELICMHQLIKDSASNELPRVLEQVCLLGCKLETLMHGEIYCSE